MSLLDDQFLVRSIPGLVIESRDPEHQVAPIRPDANLFRCRILLRGGGDRGPGLSRHTRSSVPSARV